jgi:hypothetical protein
MNIEYDKFLNFALIICIERDIWKNLQNSLRYVSLKDFYLNFLKYVVEYDNFFFSRAPDT